MIFNKKVEEDKTFRLATPHYYVAQETIAKEIKKRFAFVRGRKLTMLEIGCGTGLTTEIILGANSRIKLTAIDNKETIIRETRKRFGGKKNKRAVFLCADALKFLKSRPESSFDAVLSAMVFHNWNNKYRSKVYGEVFRILKKGGVFVNVDKVAEDDKKKHKKELEWQMKRFDIFGKMGRSEVREKWRKHYLEDEKPNKILKEGDYINELSKVGFKSIKKLYRKHMEASYLAAK